MKQQTFLKGAIILMVAGLINRVLGFLLRIIMVRYLGDEGVGLFSMIYPHYVTLILLSTGGFTVAISKQISEKNALGDVRGVSKILRLSICFVLCTSVTIAIGLLFGARWFAQQILADMRTYYLLLAIAPALVFVSVASILRSYFQGLRTMTPTAASQTIEQLVRISVSMYLITILIEKGLRFGAAGAAIGITLGEFAGMMFLLIMFAYHRVFMKGNDLLSQDLRTAPQSKESYWELFKNLAKIAVPVTVGRLVISIMYSVDAILIPNQLQQAGLSMADATSQFGQLMGIALQIIFLPTVFTSSLTTSLVPTISDALARNNMKAIRAKYHEVLRITCYIGIPATLFFIYRGRDICHLLFNFADAGSLLAILGTGAVATYFVHIAGGVLNGLGKPHLAVKNMIISAAFKIGGVLTLASHPLFGVKGAALSIAGGWIVGAIADFISIGRIVGFRMNLVHIVLKPLLGTLVLYWALPVFDYFGAYLGMGTKLITLFSIILSILFYFGWMILVRGFTKEDLKKFK